jgi:hypothetical protein
LIGTGPEWLEVGDDAQLLEPRDIGGIEQFDMRDMMPRITTAILSLSKLECIE